MNELEALLPTRKPTANRPLLGLTVLVVEDSRYACEALRLMCLKSGARIRRADSLVSARRHLQTFRPTVVIIDLGLPDGDGRELIAELSTAAPRVDVILATSGDADSADGAIAAGADGFLPKPVNGLAGFQSAVLEHLPAERLPKGPRTLPDDVIVPDQLALRDDLQHLATLLTDVQGEEDLLYASQFLASIARSSDDTHLKAAITAPPDARKMSHAVQHWLGANPQVM